jgi:hypothetical protein
MSRYDATVGQVGFRLILQVLDRDPLTGELQPSNVSTGSKEIIVLRPDGTTESFAGGSVIFTPAPVGNGTGTDGFIEAATISTTLNVTGTYEVAAYIDNGAGVTGTSQTATFEVGPDIRAI